MLRPIGSLFGGRQKGVEAGDVRYFLEKSLKEKLGAGSVRCERVSQHKAWVVVSSSTIQQEVLMVERDVLLSVKNSLGYELKKINVRIE